MQVVERGLVDLDVGGRGRQHQLFEQERNPLERVRHARYVDMEFNESHPAF